MDNSLLSLYASYKRATFIVLDWLESAIGNEKFSRASSRPTTTDVVKAATLVRDQKLAVPIYILSRLSDAIKKRRKVHGLYMEQHDSSHHEENLKHKAFIDRLEKTYQILLPQAETSQIPPIPISEQNQETLSTLGQNRYACLTDSFLTESVDNSDIEIQSEDTTRASNSSTARDTHQILRDDELGEYIELSLLVYTLDATCTKVNEYWADVASKKMSMVLAGFLTNAAYHTLKRHLQGLPELLNDNEILISKWYFTKREFMINFTDIPELQSDYRRFSHNLGLWRYWRILHDCRISPEYEEILSDAGSRQNPSDFIHRLADGRESFVSDDQAFDKMQESMRQLRNSDRAISALEEKEMRSEPLIPAMNEALQDRKSPIPTHLVVGMEMLLSTYKMHLWPNGHLNKLNCRLASLRFANDVIKSLEDCMSCLKQLCRCPREDLCICFQKDYICQFQDKLKAYLQEKRFDLYHQAPWVAAGHMVEILYWCLYEGIYLCYKSNYVTAVLHLYNALRQVSPHMRQVVWLDQLCDTFIDTLFARSLPKGNFSSAFRLSTGGRLDRTSSYRNGNVSLLSLGSSAISDRSTGVPHLSLFYAQHFMGYQVTEDFLVHIYEGRRADNPTPGQVRAALEQAKSTPLTVVMEKIKDAVLPEFQGDVPIARIDYFAIFKACIQILEELCTHLKELCTHHQGSQKPSAQLGFQLVDGVLEQITEHERDANLTHMLPHLRPLRLASLSFASLDKEKTLREFAWNI